MTMTELLLVLVIMLVLVALSIPSYSYFRRRAEDAACMANLRSLHAGLSAALHETNFKWPQSPHTGEGTDGKEVDDSDEAKWWYEKLKPFGVEREVWICPSERRGFALDTDANHYESSYVVTSFDDLPNRAYNWPNQPWVIERGGFHTGAVANHIFFDGHLEKRPGFGAN
jgi:type II secretory pathway pseudopilin PulG